MTVTMVTGHREMMLTKILTKLNISSRRSYTSCHLCLHFYYLYCWEFTTIYSMALNNYKSKELTYMGSDKCCAMCSQVGINMFLLCELESQS